MSFWELKNSLCSILIPNWFIDTEFLTAGSTLSASAVFVLLVLVKFLKTTALLVKLLSSCGIHLGEIWQPFDGEEGLKNNPLHVISHRNGYLGQVMLTQQYKMAIYVWSDRRCKRSSCMEKAMLIDRMQTSRTETVCEQVIISILLWNGPMSQFGGRYWMVCVTV